MNFPLSKSSLGGKLGSELNRLAEAINSLRPISTPDTFTSRTTGGVSRTARQRGGVGANASEFRRLLVTREGWAAVEGEDEDGNLLIVVKPWAILAAMGINTVTSYEFAGHPLTAIRETDLGTWPEEEGFFLKIRNTDQTGEPNEYWHEMVWPPYIGAADSVTSGCRAHAGAPAFYLVAARGNFALPGIEIDDATLDYYDGGAPVGDAVSPEWTDANFDARRWTPWTLSGNSLALDVDGIHVPNI